MYNLEKIKLLQIQIRCTSYCTVQSSQTDHLLKDTKRHHGAQGVLLHIICNSFNDCINKIKDDNSIKKAYSMNLCTAFSGKKFVTVLYDLFC